MCCCQECCLGILESADRRWRAHGCVWQELKTLRWRLFIPLNDGHSVDNNLKFFDCSLFLVWFCGLTDRLYTEKMPHEISFLNKNWNLHTVIDMCNACLSMFLLMFYRENAVCVEPVFFPLLKWIARSILILWFWKVAKGSVLKINFKSSSQG